MRAYSITYVVMLCAALLGSALLTACGEESTEPEPVEPLGCEASEATALANPRDSLGVEGDSRNLGPLVDTERGFLALRPVEDTQHDAYVYDRVDGEYQYTGFFDFQGETLGAVAEDHVAYTFNSESPRDGDKVGRLQVIDLAVPGQPVIAAEIEIAKGDRTCYAPPLLGRARISKAKDTLFLTCETAIAMIDVSEPCTPTVTSITPLPDIPSDEPVEHEHVLSEELDDETVRIYVLTRNRESNDLRLGIYDVENLLVPRGAFVFPVSPRRLYDVELRDGKLYAVHAKLYILDVSNPASVEWLLDESLGGQSGGFDFHDGKIWMTLLTPEPNPMRFVDRWDVSDLENPQREQRWDVGERFPSLWDLQIRRGQVYVTGVTRDGSGIQRVDVD